MTQGSAQRQDDDPFAHLKAAQKQAWSQFAPLEARTIIPAGTLVQFAGVHAGQRVLDVACGTGVVAITAARKGATASALDMTPELLAHARENAEIAEVAVDWREGDAERLPFDDGAFDVVLSQFGHMFTPRPAVVLGEMLRVLRPGGTIAFSTWPTEMYNGQMFKLIATYVPPPSGVASPALWGDEKVVRERLGASVKDVTFQRDVLRAPALSPQHYRVQSERTAGPLVKLIEHLSASDPEKLAAFRREIEALIGEYFDQNFMRQDFLMTRATKL
jgi:SAM-dependent methyltransferase